MATNFSVERRRPVLWVLVIIVLLAGFLISPIGRNLLTAFFQALRMQKEQTVNVDLSSFTDPNANPALHDMIAKMISDKVVVTVNEKDQPAPDITAASQLAGFHAQLLTTRKDAPKLTVTGEHAVSLTVDRARLQAILKEAGRSDLTLPQSLDGAAVSVRVPKAVEAQWGTCPGPVTNATDAVASNLNGPPESSTQYSDCVRLRQGAIPAVNVPPELDVANLAAIGLQVAGMTPDQAREFLQTVDWHSALIMSVPRFLRSYKSVTVNGTQGTLLTLSGRRGPGYTLMWTKDGIAYTLTGFGDSSDAVPLGNSLK